MDGSALTGKHSFSPLIRISYYLNFGNSDQSQHFCSNLSTLRNLDLYQVIYKLCFDIKWDINCWLEPNCVSQMLQVSFYTYKCDILTWRTRLFLSVNVLEHSVQTRPDPLPTVDVICACPHERGAEIRCTEIGLSRCTRLRECYRPAGAE